MAKLDLTKYGISGTTEIVHNPSYDELFAEETKPGLEGYEKGRVSELGAVDVMTGIYTGRSPKDKFIVMDENSKDTVWWTSEGYKNDNKPASKEAWDACKKLAINELSNKRLFVVDAFCGANKDTRMAIRFIMEVAWQAHFVTNMFIKPTAEELENFEPDFVVYNASKAKVENYKELGLNSETAVVFNITSREQVILNTWYGGEMKKGMFSMMNYFLPLKGIASMHCSANTDLNGENTAIFFGLSGTGKTTLSTDPKRLLIGDDEHGWDDNGVFNFEGGCYAKVINLDKDSEPDIYNAIKRDALLENVTLDDNGKTLAFITEHWNELKATPCLIHFRLATHGAVNTENTHPFRYTLGNGEHGYIAHNGIAQKHTNGRYASDSRNAILAWQTGQTDLTDGTQGKFAKIDQNGRIQWLTPPQTIEGSEGEPIQVSNTRWQDTIWDEWRTEYDDAYIEGWNDGYEAAINDMLNDGIDTTTGIRRR